MSNPEVVQERVVTRGLIGEFGVVSVLQALSLSRQYTAVELFNERGALAGRVLLKSGMVLGAYALEGSLEGAAAFREIVGMTLRSFQVERMPPPDEYPKPIGRLAAQLLAAQSASQRPGSGVVPTVAADIPRDPAAPRGFSPRVVPIAPVRNDSAEERPAPQARPQMMLEPPTRSRPRSNRPSGPPRAGAPIVAVSSPKGGAGKTTVSLNLAVSLAQSGLRVVLVDTDPNGDVLSAIAARGKAAKGFFEAIAGEVEAQNLPMSTAIPNLQVVPALGQTVPDGLSDRLSDSMMTRLVFEGLQVGVDVVVVDTPAGMFGMTAQILEVCTHVVGVLQAESIAKRSFSMFSRGLEALVHRPAVAGVVLNMFQRSHGASLSVLLDAAADMPADWMFQTTIPRNDVFLDASEAGRPVRFTESGSASVVSLLFDTLASEVKERLELGQLKQNKLEGSFLL